MIIVDTSVWIEFLRRRGAARDLEGLLERGEVLLHPFILGELLLGNLGRNRIRVVADLRLLPAAARVDDRDVLEMIDTRALSGSGIGWVDAHLLASALADRVALWTLDHTLSAVARTLRVTSAPG